MTDKLYEPFSYDTQFGDWTYDNCYQCKKHYANKYNIEPCDIEGVLNLLNPWWGDSYVSEDIARRIGYLDNQDKSNWRCNEFEPIEDKP